MKRVTVILLISLIALATTAPVAAGGATDGIDELYEQSTIIARVITTGVSIAFGVGFLINLVRAQLARGTGDRLGYSRALQQGLGMVILLALAANIEIISAGLYTIGSGINAGPSDPRVLYGVWESLAKFFATAILGGAGIYTTVSAIGSGMAGHIATITGSPTGVSSVLSNGVVLIGGGLLTLMSILFANSMIAAVF
ncbi:MAG TPA: hypothetical protein ENF27_03575 [Chloroflexi bacterium]|nr:hypothetical protein [Chloroflexota bacterium]